MMKAELVENDGCFELYFEAETVKEAALITRIGMNHTRDPRWVGSVVYDDGKFTFSVVLGKHRRADCRIPRR